MISGYILDNILKSIGQYSSINKPKSKYFFLIYVTLYPSGLKYGREKPQCGNGFIFSERKRVFACEHEHELGESCCLQRSHILELL